MDWIVILHVFTIANKCLLFPLFWFKRNNSVANRLLALLILLPAVPVLSNYFIHTGKLHDYPHIIFIYQIFINQFGPVFYFYCMVMIGQPFKLDKFKLLHLLPSVFPVIFWVDYIFSSPAEQTEFINNFLNPSHLTWKMQIASMSPVLITLPYMVIAAMKVYRYEASVKQVITSIESLKIAYIKEFVNLTLVEIIILIALHAIMPLKLIEVIWVPILGNVLYFYVVYKSYNYGVVFSEKDYETWQQLIAPLNEYVSASHTEKYAGFVLSEQKAEEYAGQLTYGFEVQKWYTDAELNLKTLSERSSIPAHYISRIINERFGKNFFDYVNSYRVEELKEKLLDPACNPIKIEEIAYMCGFNSKAAFHRAFKKYVGKSPTEYRQERTATAEVA